ncbi:hypothetical protein AB0K51_19510 [Kitasatospora sp. NPDC049285]|uniref:hypothetical protein n=1 Tax=Kitasatospora sp. NPDC049285 TaxID=3157096 RepID=UPI00343C97B5
MEPREFPTLPAALRVLWDALRALPMGSGQYDAYQSLLCGEDAAETVTLLFDRRPSVTYSVVIEGRTHAVVISRQAGA